jgi:hypothetical protein
MRLPVVMAIAGAGALAILLLPRPPQEQEGRGTAPAMAVTPVTPELLAAEVETVRGLKFRTPLKFIRVSDDELRETARMALRAAVPPEEGALRVRAALALALIRPGQEFDAADCLAGSAMEVPAAYYDAGKTAMYLNDAFSAEARPDLTARLVFHLAMALLQQHPDIVPALPHGNDDALLAALAVRHADAALTAQRHARKHAGRVVAGVSVPEPFTYHASPPFLRSLLAFPGSVAATFHAALQQRMPDADENQILNHILARPPRSTSELIHPESWPAKSAETIRFERTKLPDLPLLTENSLGECGIRTLCRTQLTSTEAEEAATGVLSDRYLLFGGSGPGQDHLLWRTQWASAEDARVFLRALAATHLGNAGIPPAAAHFPEQDRFQARTPMLHLLAAAGPGHTVTFVASPDLRLSGELFSVP